MIAVTILDDHQTIVDGYQFRLNQTPDIQVAGTAVYGEALEPLLAAEKTDVLILDINVPTAPDNPNPYPILHVIPKLLESYPEMKVLIISMHNQRSLVKAVMAAGASGYILKDDGEALQNLGSIIRLVAGGGIHLSQQTTRHLFAQEASGPRLTPRELEALSLCAAYPDETSAQLALRLGIAQSTMRNLLSNAYIQLQVRNRAAAIARASQLGLITPDPPRPPDLE